MVIELRGVQLGLKSYEFQLTLYYIHLEIAELSPQQYSFDLVAGCWEVEIKRLVYLIFYSKQK